MIRDKIIDASNVVKHELKEKIKTILCGERRCSAAKNV